VLGSKERHIVLYKC